MAFAEQLNQEAVRLDGGAGGGSAVPIGPTTPTSFNDNSVIFVSGGGLLSQDNPNFVYDSATKTFGILGTVTAGDGGVNSTSFGFASEPSLGLFRFGAGQLGVSVAAGTVAFFDTNGLLMFGKRLEAYQSGQNASRVDGVVLENVNSATAGNQKWSPSLRFTGQGWKTDATAGTETVDWDTHAVPVQGTADPSVNLVTQAQINGGGYVTKQTLTSAGDLTVTGNLASANWPIVGRTASNFVVNNSTTLADVTGLSVTLVSGKTYRITATLFLSNPDGNAGYKVATAGTASVTDLIYDVMVINPVALPSFVSGGRNATLTTIYDASAEPTTERLEIIGTFSVNAGGTLKIQFAQSFAVAEDSIVLRGSTLIAEDIT